MTKVPLKAVTTYCDRLLRTRHFTDWEGAANGLQVENRGRVGRIAASVDASAVTVRLAIAARADLLVVHHGLFWSVRQPWTEAHYHLLRLLLDHDLAVYSSHLPLDAHARFGNNVQLAAALGFRSPEPFFECKGRKIGLQARARIPLEVLADRLRQAVNGPVNVLPGGPKLCRSIGIVTGGAGAELRQAAAEGVDTFITGEGPHWTYALAEETGLNVLYAGHYATEVFGVKALAAHLSQRFGLPWDFIDHPTSL